jgi:hypothetical protein
VRIFCNNVLCGDSENVAQIEGREKNKEAETASKIGDVKTFMFAGWYHPGNSVFL